MCAAGSPIVLLGAMILVSGISGAKAADMAAVGPVLFPEMKKRGARPGELVSLLAASGAMAETIPPSLVLITIGSVTGVSIAALFTGGLLPGLVLAIALAAVAYVRSADDDLSLVCARERAADRSGALDLDPALVLPFVIRTAVVEAWRPQPKSRPSASPTRSSSASWSTASFDWRRLYPMLVETPHRSPVRSC